LARRRLAGTQSFFDLTLGRRVALHLDRRLHALQVILALDGAHQNLLPPIVMAVRGDAAIKANPVNQQVYMLVFRVEMARHNVLVVFQPHALQVVRGDLSPLVVAQMFAWRGR
jgi:hypothetical protein